MRIFREDADKVQMLNAGFDIQQAALTGSVSAATSCCLAVVVGWTVDRGYWKVLHLADRRSVCTVLSLLAALWTLGFDFLLSTRSVVLSSLMIGLQVVLAHRCFICALTVPTGLLFKQLILAFAQLCRCGRSAESPTSCC